MPNFFALSVCDVTEKIDTPLDQINIHRNFNAKSEFATLTSRYEITS